jgi:hypothetical protein
VGAANSILARGFVRINQSRHPQQKKQTIKHLFNTKENK